MELLSFSLLYSYVTERIPRSATRFSGSLPGPSDRIITKLPQLANACQLPERIRNLASGVPLTIGPLRLLHPSAFVQTRILHPSPCLTGNHDASWNDWNTDPHRHAAPERTVLHDTTTDPSPLPALPPAALSPIPDGTARPVRLPPPTTISCTRKSSVDRALGAIERKPARSVRRQPALRVPASVVLSGCGRWTVRGHIDPKRISDQDKAAPDMAGSASDSTRRIMDFRKPGRS